MFSSDWLIDWLTLTDWLIDWPQTDSRIQQSINQAINPRANSRENFGAIFLNFGRVAGVTNTQKIRHIVSVARHVRLDRFSVFTVAV